MHLYDCNYCRFKYTNLITNGDVVVERHAVKPGRDKIVYDNTVTPMATYLFFLGVGNYDTFRREFEYPDGGTFMLELLVPPDSNSVSAEETLEILHDAVIWVYLFTGPEQFDEEKLPIRNQLWEFVRKREKLKFEKKPESTLEEIQNVRNDKNIISSISITYIALMIISEGFIESS